MDDEIAVAARSIAKSICRSWLRGRCGKFFLNRRSALTKYRTNDGIQNKKMTEVLLFYKQLLHEQETDTPLVAYISYDEKLARLRLRPTRRVRPRDRTPVAVPLRGQSRVHSRTKAGIAM